MMTITYDPERKRATHAESGIAVEFVRKDHPRERGEYFRLYLNDREVEFRADYDFGEMKVQKTHPDLGMMEKRKIRIALNEMNYVVNSLHELERAVLDSDILPEIFVAVFLEVIKPMAGSRRLSVRLAPFSAPERTWSLGA